MSLMNLIYNYYKVHFKKMNNNVILWIYKNNKKYDSMVIYGVNIFKEFMIFIENYELFYNIDSDTYEFYIYGDKLVNELYEDLHVFEKQYQAFIF